MKKILFILVLLQASIYADISLCDKLAGNPMDRYLESEGVVFKEVVADKAIDACKKELKKKPKSMRALYQLGRAYDVNEEHHKDVVYYEKACKKGYASACNGLGIKYYYGQGVKESDTRAVKFYRKACDVEKNSSGCTNLAGMYEYGKGVKQNKTQAKKYYAMACARGDNYSCKMYKKLNSK